MTCKDRLRRTLLWAGAICGIALAYVCAIRYFGRRLYCPIWLATGWYCPGCGVSRMCLRLLRLDLAGAFRANPLLFSALPLLLGLGGWHILRYVKEGPGKTPRWEERVWLGLAVVFVLYGVLRNLPGLECLAPV